MADYYQHPHEQLIAFKQEVEYLRNITGTVSPPIAPVTPGWEGPQSLFHNRDYESEDPDTELEDVSEVCSMTGIRTPTNGIDLTHAQNVEAEDAYLIMKAAQHNFTKHTPKGYRNGFRRFTKKGKQFKSKGIGKQKVKAMVVKVSDAAFSTTNSRIIATVRATVAKRILLEKMGNPFKMFHVQFRRTLPCRLSQGTR